MKIKGIECPRMINPFSPALFFSRKHAYVMELIPPTTCREVFSNYYAYFVYNDAAMTRKYQQIADVFVKIIEPYKKNNVGIAHTKFELREFNDQILYGTGVI